jgi:N-acetylmuramic acid 6-phosphate etherase
MSLSTAALAALPTEARNPRSASIDQLSTLDMLTLINDEDATIAAAVRAALPRIAQAVDAIAARFAQGGRLFYLGAGTSGRLGVLDASECPPTFSVAPGLFVGLIAGGDSALRRSSESSEDSPEEGERDLAVHALTPHDSVLGIAASGRTPYVLGALAFATRAGALTIALTCAAGPHAPESPMARIAQIAIELATGPEILTGSTRMKAGTATKLVLNSISTGVMIRAGAVYGNLMVNVQPTNAKLIDRAQRIIAAATGCTQEESAHLLEAAGAVKTAIAMKLLSLDRPRAEAALAAQSGHLADALRPPNLGNPR